MSQANIPKQTQAKDREEDSFDQDLHAKRDTGINHEARGANPEQDAPNAEVMAELHRLIPSLTNDELRRVIVHQPGDVLEQGATYLDLRHMDRGEFTADKPEEVGPPNLNLIIPKSVTDYEVWNKLRGVNDPEGR